VTVRGTANLVEAAGRARVRTIVFASSLAVYGTVSDRMHDESTPPKPVSAYGKAKLAAEGIVRDAGRRFGMHVACLEPAMVYGPGCKGQLPRLVRWIARGVCPQVPELGTRRSVVHIDHLVDALMLAAAQDEANGKTYIVADPRAYSLHEMIDIIACALGRRPPLWTLPMVCLRLAAVGGDLASTLLGRRLGFDSNDLDKLTQSAWFSGERIRRELNLHAPTTFESAMPDIAASFRSI
jgi:nucleoside-diphosphate-sugar epimerase